MSTWLPPGPISIGFAVAAIAAWLLWFRDHLLFGPFFLQADLAAIGVAGLAGAAIAYAVQVGSRRARARSGLRSASPEGALEPHVWLSRAHETMDRLTRHATEEARALRHNYVGSEHLLLGALRDDIPATRAAERLGVSLDVARGVVGRLVPPGDAEVEILGVTPASRRHFLPRRGTRVASVTGRSACRMRGLPSWISTTKRRRPAC